MQEVYISLDDSGKISTKEAICVYGGLVFLSKKEKDKFITQYRSIINDIKCKYCSHNCDKKCPEIKNTTIKANDKRRIMNYIKKYYVACVVINNEKIYEHIINDKASKGRFVDYSLKRLIKEILITLINKGCLNPFQDIRVIISIDEQSTKSNGYYNLRNGIVEELKYGINNFNYDIVYKPIIYSNLEVRVAYQDSKYSYLIQASDLITGTIRREILNKKQDKLDEFVNQKVILPWKKATFVAFPS